MPSHMLSHGIILNASAIPPARAPKIAPGIAPTPPNIAPIPAPTPPPCNIAPNILRNLSNADPFCIPNTSLRKLPVFAPPVRNPNIDPITPPSKNPVTAPHKPANGPSIFEKPFNKNPPIVLEKLPNPENIFKKPPPAPKNEPIEEKAPAIRAPSPENIFKKPPPAPKNEPTHEKAPAIRAPSPTNILPNHPNIPEIPVIFIPKNASIPSNPPKTLISDPIVPIRASNPTLRKANMP